MINPKSFYDFRKLQLILSSTCNLTCHMCTIIREPKQVLDRDTVFDVMRFAVEHGFKEIEISGGEPFFVPFFHDALVEFAGRGPVIKVCTNAVMMTRETIETYARLKDIQIQVSFDGVGEVHDRIRTQGRREVFAKSDENFRLMAELGIPVSLNTVIQAMNIGNLLPLYRHFRDVPYLYHGFGLYDSFSANLELCRIPPERVDELVAELRAIREEAKQDRKANAITSSLIEHIRLMYSAPTAPSTDSTLDEVERTMPRHPGFLCTVPRTTVIVQHTGDVIPCFHYGWDRQGVRRNLRDAPIAEILFGEDYVGEAHRVLALDGCRGCNTMCYAHDPVFHRKMVNPNDRDQLIRQARILYDRQLRALHSK